MIHHAYFSHNIKAAFKIGLNAFGRASATSQVFRVDRRHTRIAGNRKSPALQLSRRAPNNWQAKGFRHRSLPIKYRWIGYNLVTNKGINLHNVAARMEVYVIVTLANQ